MLEIIAAQIKEMEDAGWISEEVLSAFRWLHVVRSLRKGAYKSGE